MMTHDDEKEISMTFIHDDSPSLFDRLTQLYKKKYFLSSRLRHFGLLRQMQCERHITLFEQCHDVLSLSKKMKTF